MAENKDILKFVEGLGVELRPWQKEVLTMLSELPEGHKSIYIPARARGRTDAVPDLDQDYIVVRKSDLGNNQLGFRSTTSFIDEDICRKGD